MLLLSAVGGSGQFVTVPLRPMQAMPVSFHDTTPVGSHPTDVIKLPELQLFKRYVHHDFD